MAKKQTTVARMYETRLVPVASIQPDDTHDPRQGHRGKADMKKLERSIETKGVLQAITITHGDQPDTFRVVAGRRRLTACATLIERGKFPADYQIPAVIVQTADVAEIRTLALTENMQREAMHPVDAFEAIRDIMAEGGDDDDAARSLGLTVKEVRQHEALGRIAPKILAEWRAGKVGQYQARAFTICDDHAKQIEVYDRLKKAYSLYPHSIRQALGLKQETITALNIVGEKAFIAAGGQVRHDLFSSDVTVNDEDLLSKMANDIVSAKVNELIADGWSWAVPSTELTNKWRYTSAFDQLVVSEEQKAELDTLAARQQEIEASEEELTEKQEAELSSIAERWEEIEGEARNAMLTPELKARTGCIVTIDHNGMTIEYAMIKPDSGTVTAAPVQHVGADQQAATQEPANARISAALLQRLTEQMTVAARKALEQRPDLAIKLLVAGLCSDWSSPVKVRSDAYDKHMRGEHFAKAFPTVDNSMNALCIAVGGFLDMRRVNAQSKRQRAAQMVLEALGAEAYTDAARAVFDADGYFAQAPKDRITEFVEEVNAGREGDDRLKAPKGKKAELATWAAARAKEIGWLPPELRFDCDEIEEPRAHEIAADQDDDGQIDGEDDEDERDGEEA